MRNKLDLLRQKIMDNMITDDRLINQRTIWAAKRFWMETENMKSKRYGGKSHRHWYLLMFFLRAYRVLFKLVGKYKEGFNNAENIVLRELGLKFPDLPLSLNLLQSFIFPICILAAYLESRTLYLNSLTAVR